MTFTPLPMPEPAVDVHTLMFDAQELIADSLRFATESILPEELGRYLRAVAILSDTLDAASTWEGYVLDDELAIAPMPYRAMRHSTICNMLHDSMDVMTECHGDYVEAGITRLREAGQ
jgi:hypothetical protein